MLSLHIHMNMNILLHLNENMQGINKSEIKEGGKDMCRIFCCLHGQLFANPHKLHSSIMLDHILWIDGLTVLLPLLFIVMIVQNYYKRIACVFEL